MRFFGAFVATTALLCAADQTMVGDGITAQILGQSGKITISQTDSASDQGSVTIRFVDVMEQDANGTAVGKTGSIKHTFNNFASKQFEFSPINQTTFQGIQCQLIGFVADALVADDTVFRVDLLLFNQSGTVMNDDEELAVEKGDVKFSVTISNWPFCTAGTSGASACGNGNKQEVGAALEFSIEVSGQSSRFDGDTFTVGGGRVIMSNKIQVDGVWGPLDAGYPKIDNSTANKILYTLRFPRFAGNATYDPIVRMDTSSGPSIPGSSNFATARGVLGLVLCLMALTSFLS